MGSRTWRSGLLEMARHRLPQAQKKVTQAQVAVQRFWELVKIEEEHWMWQGEVNEYGKPVFHNKNKIACHALRWAWQHICDYSIEFSMIPIANCGKELCVNPDHASVHVRKTKAQRRIEHEMGARQNAECGCVDIIVGCGDSTGV